MGSDSSFVCHCHSQTHSHKPASQHSSGLSSIHTGLSVPNSSLRRRCSPQSAHLPAVGRLAAAASLTTSQHAGDYPWELGVFPLVSSPGRLPLGTHRPSGCSVARCVVTNTTLTWQKCVQPPRVTTQPHFGGFSYTRNANIIRQFGDSVEIYDPNPARVEAINA